MLSRHFSQVPENAIRLKLLRQERQLVQQFKFPDSQLICATK